MRLKIGLLFALLICFGSFQNCSLDMMAHLKGNGISGEAYEGHHPDQVIFPDNSGGANGNNDPNNSFWNCSSPNSIMFAIQEVKTESSLDGDLLGFEIQLFDKSVIRFSKLAKAYENSFPTRAELTSEYDLWHTNFSAQIKTLTLTIKEAAGTYTFLEFTCL